jgi:hypothetical protein
VIAKKCIFFLGYVNSDVEHFFHFHFIVSMRGMEMMFQKNLY